MRWVALHFSDKLVGDKTKTRQPTVNLLELFCHVDDFWQVFRPVWHQHLLQSGERQRIRATKLSESEMMTILIQFHTSRFRDFKAYYAFVCKHQRRGFP